MFDPHGKTVILDLGEPEDIEPDAEDIVADMTPAERVAAFIEGMRLNSIDLFEFRCDPNLRPFFSEHEDKIRQTLNALHLVLTSIHIELNMPILRVVK